MDTMHMFEKLWRAGRALRADRRGATAIIFGLAVMPVFALTAAAIDYTRGNAARTALQMALDTTGVLMSKEASTMSEDACKTKAKRYFDAAWNSMRADQSTGHVNEGNITFDDSSFLCKPINGRWTLKMRATGYIDTAMIKIIGVRKMNYETTTQIEWGANPIRVSLALDTTGSMLNGTPTKISALKTAVAGTDGLIDLLKAQEKAVGDVYISVVPFAMRVMTDPANYTHNEYIDWTDWDAPPNNGTAISGQTNLIPGPNVGPGSNCPWTDTTNHFHCQATPTNGSARATNDKVPSSGTYSGYICPSESSSNDEPHNNRYYNGCYTSTADQPPPNNTQAQQQCTGSSCSCNSTRPNCSCTGSGGSTNCKWSAWLHNWVVNNHNTWTGCLIDRGVAYNPALAEPGPGTSPGNDQNLVAPSAGDATTRYVADQPNSWCPDLTRAMRPLNNDWTAMKTYINNMDTGGGTNQNIGLIWGWQALRGGGPLGTIPAKDANLIYDEYIILLSDGLNTGDRWYCDGTSDCPASKVTKIDSRLAGTCANIKASGTPQQSAPVIYTVQVNTVSPADAESTVLKNCATRPTDQAGLKATFYHLKAGGPSIPDTFKQIAQEIIRTHITK
jgi:Flp pilus assembly protein TadG